MTCKVCGKSMETIPQLCGQNLVYNDKSEQFECYMGEKCGHVALNQLICESCAKSC